MSESVEVRDKFMSQNIIWLMENLQKNGKGIFAAHNYHISKANFKFPQDLYKKTSCGYYLQEKLDDRYFAICTDFASGTTRAREKRGSIKEVQIAEKLNNLSHQWFEKKTTDFFVNIRAIRPSEKTGLNEDFLFNDLGSTYRGANHTQASYNLIKQFDGYLYFQQITASQKPKLNF